MLVRMSDNGRSPKTGPSIVELLAEPPDTEDVDIEVRVSRDHGEPAVFD